MNRYRERGSLKPAQVKKDDRAPNGDLQSSQTFESTKMASGTLEAIQDISTPGFKKRRSSGEVIMSPVTQTTDSRFSAPSKLVYGPVPVWGMRVLSGDLACFTASPYAWPDNGDKERHHREMAITKAHAKVGQSTAMSLVSVGEARKTASMLIAPLKSTRSLLDKMDNLRLSELQKGKTAVKAAMHAWMELRLGWKPLLFEIDAVMRAHKTLTGSKRTRMVARASSGYQDSHTDTVVHSALGSLGINTLTSSRSFDKTYKVSAGVLYELTEDAQEERARQFGFRLADVPGSLWELLYASWVIDRYLAVGWWLEAITPKPGCVIKGSWLTEIRAELNSHNVIDSLCDVTYNGIRYPLHASGGSYSEAIRVKNRLVSPSLPLTPPVNPGSHTIAQIIDEVVLITGRLKVFDVRLPSRRKITKPRQ